MKKNDFFFEGALFAICAESLFQNALGKDAYIEHIQNNWIDPVYSVPFSIIVIIAIYIVRYLSYKVNKEMEELQKVKDNAIRKLLRL